MTERNADKEAALQYLTWALELLDKIPDKAAARHTRLALEALREAKADPA